MEIASFDTQEIQITSVTFHNNHDSHQLESYPRRMVYEGREYTFTELGMRYLIKKGQQFVKLFDVSDGQTQYRLRCEADNHWTLVNMKALA